MASYYNDVVFSQCTRTQKLNMLSSMNSMASLDGPDDVLSQGYDEQFDPPAPDAYECPICLLILRKPMQTECGHRFCRGCILKVVREGRPNCPIDNETLSEDLIYPDNFARREILGLNVHCRNYRTHGCPWLKSLRDLPSHMESCEFSVIRCPNNCGEELQRKKLQYHLDEECVRRIVACLYCDLKVIFQRQNEHIERCLRYPVVCPNHCEMELVREQLNVHLESQCPKMIVKCQFRDAGCTFEGNLKELEVHMNDVNNNLHMRSLLDTVKRMERTVNVLQLTIEQMSDREEKMEVVTAGDDVNESANLMTVDGARNNKIRLAETHKLTNKMRDLEIKVAQCTTVTEMCRGEIKQTRIDTDSKCEKMQQMISDQTNLINELNARIWCGRFIWKITGFDALFIQAKNGDLPAIHSQPFYTGLPGYKMCLRVNLNGIDSGAGSHVSMFVHLMQGEFDSIVEWPFPYGLTLTIKDQDARGQPHHVTETLYARPSLQAFLRPKTPRNHKGYGYIEMIPHNTLQTNGYVKNDAMVVEVIVKTSK